MGHAMQSLSPSQPPPQAGEELFCALPVVGRVGVGISLSAFSVDGKGEFTPSPVVGRAGVGRAAGSSFNVTDQ
jgi:hypothetical protein